MKNLSPSELLKKTESEIQAEGIAAQESWRKKLASIKTKACENSKFVPPTIADCIETIVNNKSENKYIFSIVLTSCVKKITSPSQDIRIAQDNMKSGYSNRSLDQREVTPFLKRYGYTHCEASGLESGRNLERPLPWDLKYPCNPRGKGNREAFLGILDYLQSKESVPDLVAKYLLYFDKINRRETPPLILPPKESSISKIMFVFTRHFSYSKGQGKARLPVLALYAIYGCLVKELSRFKGSVLVPLERHTTADLRSKSIGDIQVDKNNQPFEGVEVKSEKPITAAMVNELPRKFNGRPVARYYILTTNQVCILPEDEASVQKAVNDAERATGCQIIVNGLIKTLWYYLRLLEDPSKVLPAYQTLLETDLDVRKELKSSWNLIIKDFLSKKNESHH